MTFEKTGIEDLILIKPKILGDDRGYFFESFRSDVFKRNGIPSNFLQENQSNSKYGVVRGLHYQKGNSAQGKLVRSVVGTVLDVAVDIRPGSATYGHHYSVKLDDIHHWQLWVPRGFAHGFAVLSEEAVIQYKCDNFYDKDSEAGIAWNDSTLGIDWGVPEKDVILSEKDLLHPEFHQHNPVF
ncbi:dTDP-4-dehydrorhamnose 3,5-epimerase [Membranihabitans maritimus]|uniref:dTDP-4-dehydrorhamnose 3,5-epimerase n=1 Tax=Membranihabitans maritimus TaxID=2904244 RepID=UPI001F0115B4|nr:dTDP-4-dehydrorhamnose 3,5-epimerase [Membranihabitans maritimus]